MNFFLILAADGELLDATMYFENALPLLRSTVRAARVTTEDGVEVAFKPNGDLMRLAAVGRDAGMPYGMAS